MGNITKHVDEPFAAKIKRGNVYLEWPDGERTATPLDVARINFATMRRVLAEFDAERRVVKLPARHG